ncbi:NAD-dependent epimerase/dehydratase family protein [Prosthecomicrobium sp. N25]|uniref:NAD-dependent epimerase/dehydratase family protein n=1 Tax=Prosthecomicrobium sp. N25 TaxID=3129254 RepID=UPI003076D2F1
MRIVVLGAAGFIGRAVIERAAASGHRAVAAVRDPRRAGGLRAGEVLSVDATDRAAVAAAVDGADAVVNCVMADPRSMAEATHAVCESALAGEATRVVHISSIAVYGAETGLVGEDAPLAAHDRYGGAKARCEGIVAAARGRGLDAVILRPALVYGPGSPLWVTRIARLLQARRLGDLGASGDGFCNLVHVDTVAAAVLAALEEPAPAHRVYNLAPEDPPTWNRYLMHFARRLGAVPVERITPRRLALERALAAPVLRAAEIAARRVGRADAVPPPITPGLAGLFGRRVRYDAARARDLVRGEAVAWEAAIDAIAAGMLQQGRPSPTPGRDRLPGTPRPDASLGRGSGPC